MKTHETTDLSTEVFGLMLGMLMIVAIIQTMQDGLLRDMYKHTEEAVQVEVDMGFISPLPTYETESENPSEDSLKLFLPPHMQKSPPKLIGNKCDEHSEECVAWTSGKYKHYRDTVVQNHQQQKMPSGISIQEIF